MAKKSKSKKAKFNQKRLFIVAFAILMLSILIYFGYNAYQTYPTTKIYSKDETVSTPDFDLKITKTELKPVDLPLDKGVVKKYSGSEDLVKHENCSKLSDSPTWRYVSDGFLGSGNGEYYQTGPSDRNICVRRNHSRDAIKKYSDNHRQFVMDYEIKATGNINTKKLNVRLIVDSGRQLDKNVDSLGYNQFLPGGETYKYKSVFNNKVQYFDGSDTEYVPYFESKLGGDINKGIVRKGYVYTDVRNSEKSIDFKISYWSNGHAYSRIVRFKL